MTPSNTTHHKTDPGAAHASNRAEVPTHPKEGNSMVTHDRHKARGHLTIADVCAELGVARSTFYDWRAAKKTPPVIKLPNGQLRIRRSAFEAWLAGLEDVA